MVIVFYASLNKIDDRQVAIQLGQEVVYVRASPSLGNTEFALDRAQPLEGETVLNAWDPNEENEVR